MAFDETLAKRVRHVLDDHPGLVEKHMFGGICFMVYDRMAVGITEDSLMVRLDPEMAAALVDEPHARPMDFTGRPMRGFLFVDAPGLESPRDLKTWVNRAVKHAESQPKKKAKKMAKKPR